VRLANLLTDETFDLDLLPSAELLAFIERR